MLSRDSRVTAFASGSSSANSRLSRRCKTTLGLTVFGFSAVPSAWSAAVFVFSDASRVAVASASPRCCFAPRRAGPSNVASSGLALLRGAFSCHLERRAHPTGRCFSMAYRLPHLRTPDLPLSRRGCLMRRALTDFGNQFGCARSAVGLENRRLRAGGGCLLLAGGFSAMSWKDARSPAVSPLRRAGTLAVWVACCAAFAGRSSSR